MNIVTIVLPLLLLLFSSNRFHQFIFCDGDIAVGDDYFEDDDDDVVNDDVFSHNL